jgi:hypothetical protein
MICTACRQPIAEGDFRYRQNDDGFLPQHRACSLDDIEWKRIDQRRQEHELFAQRRQNALQAYIEEFGEPWPELIEECVANIPKDCAKGEA